VRITGTGQKDQAERIGMETDMKIILEDRGYGKLKRVEDREKRDRANERRNKEMRRRAFSFA
jgi:hypothetical protein